MYTYFRPNFIIKRQSVSNNALGDIIDYRLKQKCKNKQVLASPLTLDCFHLLRYEEMVIYGTFST